MPGTLFKYNNSGFTLLAEIVEPVSGAGLTIQILTQSDIPLQRCSDAFGGNNLVGVVKFSRNGPASSAR